MDKDLLIGKYLSGNATDQEQKQLEEWMDEHPSHRNEFEEVKKLWVVSYNLKKEKSYNAETAWEEFEALAGSQPKAKRFYLQPLKIAAGVALLLGSVLLAKFFFADDNAPSNSMLVHEQIQVLTAEPIVSAPAADTTSVSVPVKGKTMRVKRSNKQLAMTSVSSGDSAAIYLLPDGSKVFLNKNSQLSYSGNGRNIVLQGEAFFEIKHDTLPFYVTCKSTVTKALGTSFNINGSAPGNSVEVMVLVGQVEITDQELASNQIILSAGDFGVYGNNHAFVKSKNGKKDKWWKKSSLKERFRQFFKKIREKIN